MGNPVSGVGGGSEFKPDQELPETKKPTEKGKPLEPGRAAESVKSGKAHQTAGPIKPVGEKPAGGEEIAEAATKSVHVDAPVNAAVDLVKGYLKNPESEPAKDPVFEEIAKADDGSKHSFAIGVINHAFATGKADKVLELIKVLFPDNAELVDLIDNVKAHATEFKPVLDQLSHVAKAKEEE